MDYKKQTLDRRKDIGNLVNLFYKQVRKDTLIGPIFNAIIEDWDEHLVRLTDFWEANLLGTRKFRGNPLQAHINVDKASQGTITQLHFGRWLNIWFSTIDDNFIGPNAEIAKNRARNMSTMIFLRIFQARDLSGY